MLVILTKFGWNCPYNTLRKPSVSLNDLRSQVGLRSAQPGTASVVPANTVRIQFSARCSRLLLQRVSGTVGLTARLVHIGCSRRRPTDLVPGWTSGSSFALVSTERNAERVVNLTLWDGCRTDKTRRVCSRAVRGSHLECAQILVRDGCGTGVPAGRPHRRRVHPQATSTWNHRRDQDFFAEQV